MTQVHVAALGREVKRLVKSYVLELQLDSKWASPKFFMPKKNAVIRFISDFQEPNGLMVCYSIPILKISIVLMKLHGSQWATALDLNMDYYTIRLNPDARKVSMITLPWDR